MINNKNTMNNSTDYIFWCDVETTGLDQDNDKLLQIAAIITDIYGNTINNAQYYKNIFYPNPIEIKESSNDYVKEMHNKTNLWNELIHGEKIEEVDNNLFEFLSPYTSKTNRIRLGGSSPRLDLEFIRVHLPKTYSLLHYRFIDVSGLHYVLESWNLLTDTPMQKKLEHDALSDIQETINEYIWIKKQLIK